MKKSILQVSLTRDELRFLTELADRCGCRVAAGWDAGYPCAKLLIKDIACGKIGVNVPVQGDESLPAWFEPCTRGQLVDMLFFHLGLGPSEVDDWIDRMGLVMRDGKYGKGEP